MHAFALFALRTGIFAEGRFLGKLVDAWANDVLDFVHTKLPRLLLVTIVAFILIRILRAITNRMIRIAELHAADKARISQVKTLAGVVRATGIAIILLIVGLIALSAFGINLAPLLASAGIAGVAIGLAAQTIVKDVLNGSLILIEDQFNVGDVITVAGLTGTVEAMTLRKTSIRGGDGTLFVVPNSQITTVANQSIGYSVATINVNVDFSADPNKVLALLKDIAVEVRNAPEFKDIFLAEPQVLGVDSVKGSQLVFPVVFRTKATQQYGPMREFQRRVRMALEENHFLPGDPMRVFSFAGENTGSATPGPAREKSTQTVDPTTIKPQETNPFTGQS
jgi:small conductance mechanosensitive channel